MEILNVLLESELVIEVGVLIASAILAHFGIKISPMKSKGLINLVINLIKATKKTNDQKSPKK